MILLEEAYEEVLQSNTNKLKDIGEEIADKINEKINRRYDHPRWGKDTLMGFYSSYYLPVRRFTRGDNKQYMNPQVAVGVYDTREESRELFKTKYNIDLKTIAKIGLEVVKSLGETVLLGGPHSLDETEAVKYKGIYILLKDPLKFGLVTRNKLKGLMGLKSDIS